MEINLKIDMNLLTKKVLRDIFNEFEIDYSYTMPTSLKIIGQLESKRLELLKKKLAMYGIGVVDDPKEKIVQNIKKIIEEMIDSDTENLNVNTSSYLSERLEYSYGYLSTLFSDLTLSTIENYLILQKIEMVKRLLNTKQLTISEIAFRLNYSSVSHLSNQFRKTTGLSPSLFKRIITKKMNVNRDDNLIENNSC